jgi:anaerobic selenocysteine-containing dehydrogenase
MAQTRKSFCRFCHVFCGLEVDVEDNRVVAVRGDRENVVTQGYTCQKGRAEVERVHHPDRLLGPRKRVGQHFEPIAPVRALDEIAERLRIIVDEHGPNAVAVYVGCGGHRTSAGGPWFVRRWLDALGSDRFYTSFTIDSPSLSIAGNRFFGGQVPVNLLDVERAEVVMFVGTNPLASHQLNMPQSNPSGRIDAARRRGLKLIVVDPRRSDAARRADVHLQLKPGEDATLLAGMVKVILDRNLEDAEYVAAYASGVDALREALRDFDLDYVARRSGVAAELVERAAVMFATAKTGGAHSGTGMHMASHHNLATQLVMTLNGLCGRYDRPGGLNRNEGPLGRELGDSMGPIPLPDLPKSRIRGISAYPGLFCPYVEQPTNTLTDEILTPGEGQIRALIVNGGNPALVFSEESNTGRALEQLDLLVVNDLFQSATADHADYVMAVKHPFERVDVPKLMDGTYPFPFGQYTEALIDGPEECLEEWEIFWELATRLALPLRVGGLTPERRPSSDELLDALHRHSRVPLSEIRKYPSGHVFGEMHTTAGGVIPNMIGHPDRRMAVGHPEVLAELRQVRAEPMPDAGGYASEQTFEFRLITYRMKEVYCTQGQNLPSLRAKRSTNPLLMHPDAMQEHGISDGDLVVVSRDHGRVEAVAEASADLRPDVVALAFGWGNPSDPRGVREKGCNVQRLIPADRHYDPVTGLARQSAIPVHVTGRV